MKCQKTIFFELGEMWHLICFGIGKAHKLAGYGVLVFLGYPLTQGTQLGSNYGKDYGFDRNSSWLSKND
ncbi:hypothetical protein FRX31_033444 [Thalictrum thalictroides]|uniref:Uncharacterized protein n=1 Tax=Thalictrum thalictroides TaxID=46969 RepID=A0A7J6UWN3_THATH|nr:hypothetical protein FRX31_033444 [Thalictrum thalictroides]